MNMVCVHGQIEEAIIPIWCVCMWSMRREGIKPTRPIQCVYMVKEKTRNWMLYSW